MTDLCAASTLEPRPGKPAGSTCREFDGRDPGWAVGGPLCDTELRCAERDAGLLVLDYLDLEQMIPRSLSQALDGQPAGKPGPPVPLALAPEALQAEIAHVLGTWEVEVRAVCGLSEPPAHGPNAPWHTTVSRRPPLARLRSGALVQRAVTVLAPRMAALARIESACVQPRGCEDEWLDVPGWQAVLALSDLHDRARAMLGRTRRRFWVPGECWQAACADVHQRAVEAGADPGQWLHRSEPSGFGDEPQVWCRYCDEPRDYSAYVRYVEIMVWPSEREPVAA